MLTLKSLTCEQYVSLTNGCGRVLFFVPGYIKKCFVYKYIIWLYTKYIFLLTILYKNNFCSYIELKLFYQVRKNHIELNKRRNIMRSFNRFNKMMMNWCHEESLKLNSKMKIKCLFDSIIWLDLQLIVAYKNNIQILSLHTHTHTHTHTQTRAHIFSFLCLKLLIITKK